VIENDPTDTRNELGITGERVRRLLDVRWVSPVERSPNLLDFRAWPAAAAT
jgi:hypothetical protein